MRGWKMCICLLHAITAVDGIVTADPHKITFVRTRPLAPYVVKSSGKYENK